MTSILRTWLARGALSAGVFGLIAFTIGRYAPPAIEDLLQQGIIDHIVWRPDSPTDVDARYRGPPGPDDEPDLFRVWLFNLTNLEAVRGGAKPVMAEVGPLTYVKYRIKVDTWWDRRGRVAIKEWDYHVFRPDLSAAFPNASITTLNLPLLGVMETLHAYANATPAVRPLIDVLLGVLSGWRDEHVDGLFTKRTAGELLWGYEDLLLQRLMLLLGRTFVRSSTVRLIPNATSAEDVLASQPPNIVDTGWRPASEGAASSGGAATPGGRRGGGGMRPPRTFMYDESRIWNIESESGWTNVSSWGPNCTEHVRGTDGFQFRPGLDSGSKLRVWITELFRSAALRCRGDDELHGIRLLRFEPDPREGEPDTCHHQRIRGLANVTVPMAVGPNGNYSSEAAHGVPLYMSMPHYCKVDPRVAAAMEGVRCDPEKHDLFLDVEPLSGITMRAAKRVQLSSEITDSSRATLEPSLRSSLILPVFWAEEASQISAARAAAFRRQVYGTKRLAAMVRRVSYPTAVALAALAAAGALAAGALAVRTRGGGGGGGGRRYRGPPAPSSDAAGGANGATVPPEGMAVTGEAAAGAAEAAALAAAARIAANLANGVSVPAAAAVGLPDHNREFDAGDGTAGLGPATTGMGAEAAQGVAAELEGAAAGEEGEEVAGRGSGRVGSGRGGCG